MQIKDGKIRPCPKCLQIRQGVKRLAERLAQSRQYPFELITTSTGETLILDGPSGEVRVASTGARDYVGKRIYRTKNYLFDIETADRLDDLGSPANVVGMFDAPR